jgi:hypothetical protein
MSTLRISDAPLLPDVEGTEKIPTGGRGDYAISVDQIKGHIFQDIGKELVGLGNVDNTSDLDKPVSTAQQAALNLKADKTYVDTNLDLKADKTNVYTRSETTLALSQKADLVDGVVPENQIPSSFNDVLEFTTPNLPIVGESGKIYVTTDNNKTWRWGGNKYVEISGWNPDSVSKTSTLPTYYTKEAGVDSVTGVTDGAYYNVRSTEDDTMLVEYQNVGGVGTPSGKSYPSNMTKWDASAIFDGDKNQHELNNFFKSQKLIDTRLYGLKVNTGEDQTAAIHAAFADNPNNQYFYIPKGVVKANVVFPRAYMYLVGDGLLNTIIEPFDLTKSPVNFNKKLYAGLTDLTVQASQQFTGESLVNAQEVRYMHLENFDVRKTKLAEETHSYQTILIDNRAIAGSWTGYNRLHNVRAVYGAYGYLADVDKLNSVLSIKDSLFSFNGYFNIKTSASNSTIINCDIANGGKLQPAGVYDETQYGGAYIKGDNSVILGVWHEINAQASPSYNSNNLYIHPDSWNITHNFARDTRGTNNVRVYTQSQGQLQDVNTADRSLNDGQGRARPQQLIKNGNFAHWDSSLNRPKGWSGYFSGTWTQETTDLPKGYNAGLKVVSDVAGVCGIYQAIYNPTDLSNSYIKDISKWIGREISVSFWVKNIGTSETAIRGGISIDLSNVYFSSGTYISTTKVGEFTKVVLAIKVTGSEERIWAGIRVSGVGEGMIVAGYSVADDCRVNDSQAKTITEDGGEVFGSLEVRGTLTNNGVQPVFQPTAVTTTGLTNATGSINTVGKFAGKQVFNNTNSLMYYALGSSATSAWKSFDSTNTITPA